VIWIGIDPGHTTGIVVRDGSHLLWHAVVKPIGTAGCEIVTQETLRAVHAAVWEAVEHAGCERLAIEGVVPPTGFKDGKKAFISPISLAAPAVVLGSLRMSYDDITWVRPGGHGSRPLSTYPAALVTPGEARHGLNRPAPQNSTIRHARSGWDIAGAAVMAQRLQRAGAA
jgi:hypothetical protein